KTNLPRSGTFWDVGANIGWFSMYAATLTSGSGSVLSFEPSPQVVKLLRWNVAAYPKIQVFDCKSAATRNRFTPFWQLRTDGDKNGPPRSSTKPRFASSATMFRSDC